MPYNGSVARVNFGPLSAARTRRWLEDGDFDVVHVHEPISPEPVAARPAGRPTGRSSRRSTPRTCARGRCRRRTRCCGPSLEKISARIAVSEDARRTVTDAHRRRRGGDPERRVRRPVRRRRSRAREWPGTPERADGRLPRPDRRAAQGAAGAARRAARRAARACRECGCSSPGRATPTRPGRICRRRCGGLHLPRARSATPTRPRCCGRSTCTSRRTPAARASASCWSRRWRRRAGAGQRPPAFRRVLDDGRVRRAVRGRRRGRRSPPQLVGLLDDPGGASRALARRGREPRCGATTGRWWPRQVVEVYETVRSAA